MKLSKFSLIVVLFCTFVLSANAQETRGSIIGRVLDSSGAVVPRANITATNVDTNVSQKTVTNAEGSYEVLYLLPSRYNVSAEATGFKKALQEVQILIHERTRVDFSLEVGAMTEQVKVTAQAEQLQTGNANIGQVLDSRTISELPIAFGAPYGAIFMLNGVSDDGYGRNSPDQNNMDMVGSSISGNGAPIGHIGFTIDGTSNLQMAHYLGPAFSPPMDLIDEMKVETAFDASVGSSSGLVINIALKGGTNSPHGTAYGFFSNPDLTANQWFNNLYGQAKPDFGYKRWGATLTGPVYIPKLFNGRNRTFFTYGYEADVETTPGATVLSVPNPKNATGDFSNLLALGSQYEIYDPLTIQSAPNGRLTRDPFPGNIIPASRISPIAKAILAHYPQPNTTGNPDGENNYAINLANPDAFWSHTARVDHNISDKQRLFVRATSAERGASGSGRKYWNDVAEGTGGGKDVRTTQASLDYVNTLNSSTVLDLRYGYSRFTAPKYPDAMGFDVSQLGFPTATVQQLQMQEMSFPTINISGLQSLGWERHSFGTSDSHDLSAVLNKQHGDHGIKVGVEIIQQRVNYANYAGGYSVAGTFGFGSTYTNGPFDNSPSSPGGVGQGLAALLLGQPDSGGISEVANQATRSTNYALYFHDNWRATQKLTLDLGLRWEYVAPPYDRYDRSVGGWDPTAAQPIAAAALAAYAANPDPALPVDQFKVQGGLLFAGVGGVPRSFWNDSKKFFAPRFGLAYQVRPKVVLRGGFGIFQLAKGLNPSVQAQAYATQTGFSQDTPLVTSNNNGVSYFANLANPFPNGLISPPGASLGAATDLGTWPGYYDRSSAMPYSMQWNMNIQTMLPGNFLLEVGYLGNKSIRLPVSPNMNAIPQQYLSTSPVRDQTTIDYLSAQVPNPFAGLVPGSWMNGATESRWQLLTPYPQYYGIGITDYQGWSWYNAMPVRLERRFGNGFTMLVNYTFSKSIDATLFQTDGDPVPTKAISYNDRPQQFSLSAIWELPFGKGKPVLGNGGRFVNTFVGGWQLSGVWQVNSGLLPYYPCDCLLKPGETLNDIALPSGQQTLNHWFNTDAFVTDPNQQLANNKVTFPLRLSSIRGGTYNSTDISLLKNISLHENHHFQLRFEAFNAFNDQKAWSVPDTTPTDSSFGQVRNTYSLPRQLQLGIKYMF